MASKRTFTAPLVVSLLVIIVLTLLLHSCRVKHSSEADDVMFLSGTYFSLSAPPTSVPKESADQVPTEIPTVLQPAKSTRQEQEKSLQPPETGEGEIKTNQTTDSPEQVEANNAENKEGEDKKAKPSTKKKKKKDETKGGKGKKKDSPNKKAKNVTAIEQGPSFYSAVITINDENNRPRFEGFQSVWKEAWPSLEIHKQVCFLNSPKLRSYSVFACTLLALWKFLDTNNSSNKKYDYMIVFEDDGYPFPQVKWPDDLVLRLKELEKHQGAVFLMGGHNIHGPNRDKLKGDELIFRAVAFYGAYGYVIRADLVQQLADSIADELKVKADDKSNIEAHLRKMYTDKGIFASVPLLVDHHPGYSNTWGTKKAPGREFEGHRDFWNWRRLL